MIGIRHGTTGYLNSHAITKQRRKAVAKAAPAAPARPPRRRMPTRERRKGPWGPSENGNALHERNGLSSHGLHRSTFGDGELNCRVRHGTG